MDLIEFFKGLVATVIILALVFGVIWLLTYTLDKGLHNAREEMKKMGCKCYRTMFVFYINRNCPIHGDSHD